jgi:hypothetical protein
MTPEQRTAHLKHLWYTRNKEAHLAKKNVRRSAKRNFINQQKIDNPYCTDCGLEYPSFILEFDHLPEFKKSFSLSDAGHDDRTIEEILEEIAKCEIVCSNCHRFRTEMRKAEKANRS